MSAILDNLLKVLNTWWTSFIENSPAWWQVCSFVGQFVPGPSGQPGCKTDHAAAKRLRCRTGLAALPSGKMDGDWPWDFAGSGAGRAGCDRFADRFGHFRVYVGFALQDISANLVSGILLLFEQPFDIGDSIEVSGYGGTVKEINLRATHMLTWEGLLVIIPNREVFTNTITNYTRISQRRIALSVGVGYDSDLKQVEELALKTVKDLPGTLDDPGAFFMVDSFADSAINTTVYYWFKTGENGYPDMVNAGATAIKKAFDQAEIDIPYPIRSVRVETMPAPARTVILIYFCCG